MHSRLSTVSKYTVVSSLLFLAIGNCVGLFLSILLTFPNLNSLIEPFTYGKIIPVHLNFQLYGWCGIPLIGLIYFIFLRDRDWFNTYSVFPLVLWSFSLFLGAISWLSGDTSGKIFLEWEGISKHLFLFNLIFLWMFLFYSFSKSFVKSKLNIQTELKGTLLLTLSLIPYIFLKALDPHNFPPINKISSGATGSSLLLSTLAIVFIMLLFPLALKIEQKRKRAHIFPFFALSVHFFSCFFINLSHSTNLDLDQLLGLGSLIIWVPIMFKYYSSYRFEKYLSLWLLSALVWGTVLVVSAVFMFLPASLILVKFTSFLVAHVHLAMSGFVSSILMTILCSLPFSRGIANILCDKLNFYLFQAGLLIHLTSLTFLGILEHSTSGVLYTFSGNVVSNYITIAMSLRIVSGMLLLLPPSIWFLKIHKLHVDTYHEN